MDAKKGILERDIYFGKYKPIKKIGEGSFGMIYLAVNEQTGEKYALKFEEKKKKNNLLESEAYILSYLKGRMHFIYLSWYSFCKIIWICW
jgi:serine/threonine protein kinase